MTQQDGSISVLVGGTDLVSGVFARKMVAQTDQATGQTKPGVGGRRRRRFAVRPDEGP